MLDFIPPQTAPDADRHSPPQFAYFEIGRRFARLRWFLTHRDYVDHDRLSNITGNSQPPTREAYHQAVVNTFDQINELLTCTRISAQTTLDPREVIQKSCQSLIAADKSEHEAEEFCELSNDYRDQQDEEALRNKLQSYYDRYLGQGLGQLAKHLTSIVDVRRWFECGQTIEEGLYRPDVFALQSETQTPPVLREDAYGSWRRENPPAITGLCSNDLPHRSETPLSLLQPIVRRPGDFLPQATWQMAVVSTCKQIDLCLPAEIQERLADLRTLQESFDQANEGQLEAVADKVESLVNDLCVLVEQHARPNPGIILSVLALDPDGAMDGSKYRLSPLTAEQLVRFHNLFDVDCSDDLIERCLVADAEA